MEDRETFYQTDGEGNILEISVTSGEVVARSNDTFIPKRSVWVFNEVIGDIICQRLAEGMTLSKVCSIEGFPSIGVVKRWQAENGLFNEAVELAEKARAEGFHDRIVDSLDEVRNLSKDEIPAAKLYSDNLKYLAKVNDRKKYGERDQKITGGGGDVIIQLNTGINRSLREIPSEVIEVVEQQNKE